MLETARVNGTDISESLRPTVTKKNILLVKVEFLRFLTCIEPQEGKVNQTQFSLSLFSFNPLAFMLFSLKVCAVQ